MPVWARLTRRRGRVAHEPHRRPRPRRVDADLHLRLRRRRASNHLVRGIRAHTVAIRRRHARRPLATDFGDLRRGNHGGRGCGALLLGEADFRLPRRSRRSGDQCVGIRIFARAVKTARAAIQNRRLTTGGPEAAHDVEALRLRRLGLGVGLLLQGRLAGGILEHCVAVGRGRRELLLTGRLLCGSRRLSPRRGLCHRDRNRDEPDDQRGHDGRAGLLNVH